MLTESTRRLKAWRTRGLREMGKTKERVIGGSRAEVKMYIEGEALRVTRESMKVQVEVGI